MLDKLRQEINISIGEFLSLIRKEYRLDLVNPILYESIREFSLRPGKRIRPLLLLLSYLGYSKAGKKISRSVYNASTCIEFLHNFMLIHDDIIDRSELRRGQPTMHRVLRNTISCPDPDLLGINLGIIAGDIVYAFAIDAFLSIKEDPARKERALKYFIQTAAFTAMGEFVDTVHGVDRIDNVQEKDVYLNYSLKTARYTFDCPLVTGAILAGASKKETDRLAKFGLLIGQAFQIQDDVIGIFESEDTIGKSILSDLEEQKKTLLVAHAYKALSGARRKAFLQLFSRTPKTAADLEEARTIFISAGSLDYCLNAVKTRTLQAKDILDSLSMLPRYRQLISDSLFQLFGQSETIARRYEIKN